VSVLSLLPALVVVDPGAMVRLPRGRVTGRMFTITPSQLTGGARVACACSTFGAGRRNIVVTQADSLNIARWASLAEVQHAVPRQR
jgi:hypothetical protein